jgi:hypothetical protein
MGISIGSPSDFELIAFLILPYKYPKRQFGYIGKAKIMEFISSRDTIT